MKRHWTPDELLEHWPITPAERSLIMDQKAEHTRLGFALLLKFFQNAGRFPHTRYEVPPSVIVYLANQLGIPADQMLLYDWDGRTIKQHRAAIRARLGFREATLQDVHDLSAWLGATMVAQTRQIDALKATVIDRCRALRIEPPSPDQVDRLVRSAIATYDQQMYAQVAQRLTPSVRQRLEHCSSSRSSERQPQRCWRAPRCTTSSAIRGRCRCRPCRKRWPS